MAEHWEKSTVFYPPSVPPKKWNPVVRAAITDAWWCPEVCVRSTRTCHRDCPVDILWWIFNVASQPIRCKKDLFAAVAVLLQQNYFKDHFRFIWRESNNRLGNRCGEKQTENRSRGYIYVQLYKPARWKIKIIPLSIMASRWSKRCLSIYNFENCNLAVHLSADPYTHLFCLLDCLSIWQKEKWIKHNNLEYRLCLFGEVMAGNV